MVCFGLILKTNVDWGWRQICTTVLGWSDFCYNASETYINSGPFQLLSISTTGTIGLYGCSSLGDFFLSLESNCTGQLQLLGHLTTIPTPNTNTPIYACQNPVTRSNYHSLGIPCSSKRTASPLGYVNAQLGSFEVENITINANGTYHNHCTLCGSSYYSCSNEGSVYIGDFDWLLIQQVGIKE